MTQPAGPFQMPPPTTKAANPVSAAGYWIGGAILVLGCGAALVWLVVTVVGLVEAPDDFDRFSVPGSATLALDDGDWMIYHEYFGADQDVYVPPPSIDVTGPDGQQLGLLTVSSDFSYGTGQHDGVALYEFRAPEKGLYTITASTFGEPSRSVPQGIAIGRPLFDWSSVGGILGSLALGALSFIAGLVVIIVTIVRRGRARRRLQPAMAPFGAPPPYGGPGYGAPPYPPAPYPPPPQGAGSPGSPAAPPGGPAPTGWPVAPAAPPPAGPPPAPSVLPPAPQPPPPAPSPWAAPGQPDHTPPEGEPDRPAG